MASEFSTERERQVNVIIAAYLDAERAGQAPDHAELLRRHPSLAADLQSFFADREHFRMLAQPLAPVVTPESEGGTLPPERSGDTCSADDARQLARVVDATELAIEARSLGTVRYFGDYELLEEIARGGMGVVYKARQVSLDRVVALKMILSGQLASPSDVQRFHAEAKTAAGLHHANIVAIHEVGQDQGQHYFSMDYVAGASLAQVLRDGPLTPQKAGGYVKTVALAIHYAHQQGVLHRDLKPANVLIDPHDQPRVTDFGLARRLEADTALTASGAVLGTPSYMPPEQAAAERGVVSRASDVYSLGAVLYELVTGRPPFRAATPVETILQVLDSEPAPPRLLNPAISRDLETIILKCLAKAPAKRYASAQALAEDLQACLDGRPIQARRPSLAERAGRWLVHQRRAVARAVVTAAATVAIVIAVFFAWQSAREARLGKFRVTTNGPVLEATLLNADDEPVTPAFTVPMRQPLSVPAGRYRLRVTGLDRLGETHEVLVRQGEEISFHVGAEAQLWAPLDVPKWYEIVPVDGRHDLIVHGPDGLRRIHGGTREEVWHREMTAKRQEVLAGITDNYVGGWKQGLVADFGGDGDPHLLLWSGMETQTGLTPISIKTDLVKWVHKADYVATLPILADVDGDGKPDVILCTSKAVEAVSGLDSKLLWRQEIDLIAEQMPKGPQGEEFFYYRAMNVARIGDRPELDVIMGRRLSRLDLPTGKPIAPDQVLPFWPWQPPRFIKATGDDQPAMLLFQEDERPSQNADSWRGMEITALALSGKTCWRHVMQTRPRRIGSMGDSYVVPEWPVALEVENGVPAIVVPKLDRDWSWVGVELLDAGTGQRRWQRRLGPGLMDDYGPGQEMLRFAIGPDLDGDGGTELFVAHLCTRRMLARDYRDRPHTERDRELLLSLSAVSGATGRILWQTLQPLGTSQVAKIGALRWWHAGSDGHPLLAVNLTPWQPQPEQMRDRHGAPLPRAYLFAASTGKVVNVIRDLDDLDVADLDGDGIPELFGLRYDPMRSPYRPAGPAAKLHALRGTPPHLWRRPGNWQQTIEMQYVGGGWRDGRYPNSQPASPRFLAPPLPLGDLDGDGVPDLLVLQPQPMGNPNPTPPALQAFSGKDGRRLWSVARLPDDPKQKHPGNLEWAVNLELRALGHGQIGVLIKYFMRGDNNVLSAAFSAKDGTLLWKEPRGVWPLLVDLDGDGTLDRLAETSSEKETVLEATSGANGSVLWQRSSKNRGQLLGAGALGRDTAVLVSAPSPKGHTDLEAWDGKTGNRIWSWKGWRDFHERPAAWRFAKVVASDQSALCMLTRQGAKGTRLIVLDERGQERVKKDYSFFVAPDAFVGPNVKPHLWSHDLVGDGREALILISGKFFKDLDFKQGRGPGGSRLAESRVTVLRAPFEEPLWEWPIPGGEGEVLAVLPAGSVEPAIVVAAAGKNVYGLDGATGRLRWRCDGPGQALGLEPRPSADGLPGVLFYDADADATICLRALPVGADGKYRRPHPKPLTYDSEPPDLFGIRPLPWQLEGQERWPYAIAPALACLGLVGWNLAQRRWWLALGLTGCLVLPGVWAGAMLMGRSLHVEQHWDTAGWPWLWPWSLGAPLGWKVLLSPLTWMILVLVGTTYRRHLPRLFRGGLIVGLIGYALFLLAVVSFLVFRAGAAGEEGLGWMTAAAVALIAAASFFGFLMIRRRRQHRVISAENTGDEDGSSELVPDPLQRSAWRGPGGRRPR